MNHQQTRAHIRDELEGYLSSKGINTRRKFRCLNPAHPDTHPSMSYDPKRQKAHCFACGADYDTFDLIGIDYGLTQPGDIYRKGKELYGLDRQPGAARKPAKAPPDQSEGTDETAYIEACRLRVGQTGYFTGRGLTQEIIARFCLGYDPDARAAVIPVGAGYCIRRSVDQKRFYNPKGRETRLFNAERLAGEGPVFVTESALDAISVEQAGGRAVGLNGVSNVSKLLDAVKEARLGGGTPLLLALDNDQAGEAAAARLTEGLREIGAPCLPANVSGPHKDPNDHLQADPGGLARAVRQAMETAGRQSDEAREAERAAYTRQSAVHYIQDFMDGIAASVDTPWVPTGFSLLDGALDGGLYEGLYILGAISSLGKTSFVLQLADQAAQLGQDVVIFSLEMARTELMAKSVSRMTFLLAGDARQAKTARGITAGKRYARYAPQEKALIQDAVTAYAAYADRVYIREGYGETGVQEVRTALQTHIDLTGRRPVAVVDYLQLLAGDPRATDKQNTDRAVLELKRISRDLKIPVLAISSFNRQSYALPVTMEAFKESGAIEYSSDVLIGLQAQGAGGRSFDIDEAKRKDPREIELKVLKNRNGPTGGVIGYDYYPMFNCFRERG